MLSPTKAHVSPPSIVLATLLPAPRKKNINPIKLYPQKEKDVPPLLPVLIIKNGLTTLNPARGKSVPPVAVFPKGKTVSNAEKTN